MAVWMVNRTDPEHTVYFPSEENARCWLENRNADDWAMVPISDEEDARLRKRVL